MTTRHANSVDSVFDVLNKSADGDTIIVAPGTYDFPNRINIDKILYIYGEELGNWDKFPVFRFASSLDNCIFYLHTVAGGSFERFKLYPLYTGTPTYLTGSVIYYETDLFASVRNTILRNILIDGSQAAGGQSSLKGISGRFGFGVSETDPDANCLIENFYIRNLKNIGMHFNGWGKGTRIRNGEISNLGPSGVGNHGMDVTFAKSCLIENLNIHDITDTTPAYGIYLVGPKKNQGDVHVSNIYRNITIQRISNGIGLALQNYYVKRNAFYKLHITDISLDAININYGGSENTFWGPITGLTNIGGSHISFTYQSNQDPPHDNLVFAPPNFVVGGNAKWGYNNRIAKNFSTTFNADGFAYMGDFFITNVNDKFTGYVRAQATLVKRSDGYIPDISVTFCHSSNLSGNFHLRWLTDKAELYRLPPGTYEVTVLLTGEAV